MVYATLQDNQRKVKKQAILYLLKAIYHEPAFIQLW